MKLKEIALMLNLTILITMKMKINSKNVMILVQNVMEKDQKMIIDVLNVLLDITLFIIKLDYVLLLNQMIVIMMKKMIHLKNVIALVELVKKEEMQVHIIVKHVMYILMELMLITLFILKKDNVLEMIKNVLIAI